MSAALAATRKATSNLRGALRDPAARILRDLVIEQKFGLSRLLATKSDDARSTANGAFAVYNPQFKDVVLGVVLDHTHARMKGVSTDSIERFVVGSNGYFNSVYLSGLASANLNDYGSLRARLGYVTGPFMPFVTGGIALGRFDSTRTVAIDIQSTDTRTPRRPDLELVQTETIGPKETFVVGLTAGLGVDLALTQNIFLRAEYQYIHFDDFNGNKLNVNTVRGGAGVKF